MEPRLKEWPWAAVVAELCKRVLRLNYRPLVSGAKTRISFLGAETRAPCTRGVPLPNRSPPFGGLGVETRGQGGDQDAGRRRRVGHSRERPQSRTLLSLRRFFPT